MGSLKLFLSVILLSLSFNLWAQVHGCCNLYRPPLKELTDYKKKVDKLLMKLETNWKSCINPDVKIPTVKELMGALAKRTIILFGKNPPSPNDSLPKLLCQKEILEPLKDDLFCVLSPSELFELKSLLSPPDQMYSHLVMIEKYSEEDAKLVIGTLDMMINSVRGK